MPNTAQRGDTPTIEGYRLLRMLGDGGMPSFRKLRDFIANDYLPKTRDSVGLNQLPNGDAWYAFKVRGTTTTDLSPAQIHQIGLDEVARIHGEMEKVMQQVGFKGSLQDFFQHMRAHRERVRRRCGPRTRTG